MQASRWSPTPLTAVRALENKAYDHCGTYGDRAGGGTMGGRGRTGSRGITAQTVDEAFDDVTLARGWKYLEGGRVLEAVDLGDELWGRVVGRMPEPYEVRLRMSGGALEARCTCPMEAMCKHCAALALKWALDPASFVDGGAVLRSVGAWTATSSPPG